MTGKAQEKTGLYHWLKRLYHGRSKRALRFSYALLIFDLAAILYFVISSMLPRNHIFVFVDIIVGLIVLLDFMARLWLAKNKAKYFGRFSTWADIIVIVTLFLPMFVENLVFLRILRSLRLLRSYHILRDLRKRYRFFRQYEDVIQSVLNLSVFLFVVTAIVYVVQEQFNDGINNYLDALYFTVATLTTTGFGDITLQGASGKALSVIIMVVGISLFLRLVQTIFRPAKVKYKCPECGLNRHDKDAVHCKHCGEALKIETEGL